MTATGNELVTLNQLKTFKDSFGGGEHKVWNIAE